MSSLCAALLVPDTSGLLQALMSGWLGMQRACGLVSDMCSAITALCSAINAALSNPFALVSRAKL